MVKHCSFGTCKSDSRYPDKLNGAKFKPFPKPKTNLPKCMRQIALCHRPQDQLNVNKTTKDTYICTKVRWFIVVEYTQKHTCQKNERNFTKMRSYLIAVFQHGEEVLQMVFFIYISQHFVNNDGPTTEYPDPCVAKSGGIEEGKASAITSAHQFIYGKRCLQKCTFSQVNISNALYVIKL